MLQLVDVLASADGMVKALRSFLDSGSTMAHQGIAPWQPTSAG